MAAKAQITLTPTDEQQAIIDAITTGDTVKVEACAGSGKTATLAMAANELDGDVLYLAYNKEAQKSAEKRFGKAATCRTTHSLAFGAIGKNYMEAGRIGKRVPATETARLLQCSNVTLDLGNSAIMRGDFIARMASDTITRFCYSADQMPSKSHVPHLEGLTDDQYAILASEIHPWAKKLWRDSTQLNSAHYFSHDMYMKMWALTEPQLDYYETILLDEAQDSSRLVRKIVLDQHHAQVAVIGDSAQAIYGWRGATNVLSTWPSAKELTLSQSWRFGAAVAEEANAWLPHTGTDMLVAGNPNMASTVVTDEGATPDAVLCRTNAMSMNRAIEYIAKGLRVCIAGGTDSLKQLLYAASSLMAGKPTSHPELVMFKTWKELCAYTEEEQGRDLKMLVGLINRYGIDALLSACKATVTPSKAEITISTAHKAKGLEWNHVEIADDFREPAPELDEATMKYVPGKILKPEAMLAYVAVTRARGTLDNKGLAWVHDRTSDPAVWNAKYGR
jgi:superfamily I DNA/RNA helicase